MTGGRPDTGPCSRPALVPPPQLVPKPLQAFLLPQCLIGDRWVGDGTLPVTDPATGIEIARVPSLGRRETLAAIDAAKAALAPWASRLAKDRSRILRRWFDLVIAQADELAHLLTLEQGKPLAEARAEIDYAASYIEFYGEEAKRLNGEILPSHVDGGRVLVLRQPVGVVAAITPWNFPAAMVTRKLAPALAAGCTVVLKPALETPLTALKLARLAEDAGLPPGCLNVVTGDAAPIGEALCQSPDVRALTFTGSTRVGTLLMEQCARTVKRLGLELGGNAPFIVFDDCDLNDAVRGAVLAKFRNAGQTCIAPNRFYVHQGVYDAFADRMSAAMAALRPGPGLTPGNTLGPLISEAAVRKVEAHIADAVARGAQIKRGGQRCRPNSPFFEPTLVTEVTEDMRLAREETFGPVAGLVRFDAEADVIARANDTRAGLAGYVYTRDMGRVWRVMESLETGMVAANSGKLSSELAPFGGIKESGQGREGSRHGMDEFTELKYALLAGV